MDVIEMDQKTNKPWGKKQTETKQSTCVQMESCTLGSQTLSSGLWEKGPA